MPKSNFQCSDCKRKFSMAAHLARHRNSAHPPKRKNRAGAPKAPRGRARGAQAKKKRPTAKASRRHPAVSSVGTSASLMTRMRALERRLAAEQAQVEFQIAVITRVIDAIGGAAGATDTGRNRPVRSRGHHRPGSLKEAVHRVLQQSSIPLGPAEIAIRVVKGGYKTTGSNLANMIGSCLRSSSHIKKSGRGRYGA